MCVFGGGGGVAVAEVSGEIRGDGGGLRCQAYNWGEEISRADRGELY